MPVDALDARILQLLLQQPRTSVREYARILGVARGTLQVRLDRLERDGVITAAGPRVSPTALGHPVLAFVRIEVTQGHLDEVGEALAAVPEIIEAFSITGGGDLLTRVVARDNAHLEDIIQRLIRLPGVVRTRTEIALRERVAERVLPLVEAVGHDAESGRRSRPPQAAQPGPDPRPYRSSQPGPRPPRPTGHVPRPRPAEPPTGSAGPPGPAAPAERPGPGQRAAR
jgi:DNA-binding Lrp family transcriptional regulator